MAKSRFGIKSLAELKKDLDVDWNEEGMFEAYEPSDIVIAYNDAALKCKHDLKKVAEVMDVPMSWVEALFEFEFRADVAAQIQIDRMKKAKKAKKKTVKGKR
jgi:hypothetical protein